MSNIPIVNQPSWISLVSKLLLIALFIYLFHILALGDPFINGSLAYLMLFFILRTQVAKSHRKGMQLVNQQKFIEAIPLFENSVDFFTKNSWVDKYRYLTLLSSSKMSNKEMGLCNIAICYSQTNNVQKAREYYERVVREFPENSLAITGLKMLNSFEQTVQKEN
jgi:tetratricopeptide (TPR) repeat protein